MKVQDVFLFAWVGEDELGSGEIGLKQGMVPAGMIPLVSVNQSKMVTAGLLGQLQRQADEYGKTIQLCRFVFSEVMVELVPGKQTR